MDRLQNTDLSATPPSATTGSTGYPRVATPGGPAASSFHPWYIHMLIEELRAVIVAAGLTPAYSTLTQLNSAIAALIAASNPDGTESAKGHVELATDAETIAGTSDALATHPKGVKAAIDDALMDGLPNVGILVSAISASNFTSADTAAALAAVTGLTSFSAGSTVHYHRTDEFGSLSPDSTYTARVSFYSARSGTFTFGFDQLAPGDSDSGFRARYYVNGVAVGTEMICTSDVWATVASQDLVIAAGDLIELRTRYNADATGNSVNKIRNFAMRADSALPGNITIEV